MTSSVESGYHTGGRMRVVRLLALLGFLLGEGRQRTPNTREGRERAQKTGEGQHVRLYSDSKETREEAERQIESHRGEIARLKKNLEIMDAHKYGDVKEIKKEILRMIPEKNKVKLLMFKSYIVICLSRYLLFKTSLCI